MLTHQSQHLVPNHSEDEKLANVTPAGIANVSVMGTLRSNDATATRTSLKKVYLRSFSLYRDYSYPITVSNVGEPS